MSLRKFIKYKMLSSLRGQILFYKIRILREKYALATLTDEQYVKKTYKERFGYEINLNNPKTFQEKLQWLKLNYRNLDMPQCSDKYEVRNYLEEKGYGFLLNDLIGVYDNAKDINFDSLPNKFVAKANHGSGWNLICEDKTQLNWKQAVKLMNSWLKLNLYVFGREWNYKDIKPKIVIEKYLEHRPLNDYKYMCYNGKPEYMQVNNDVDGEHYVDFIDLSDWSLIPVTYGPYKMSGRLIEKPKQFDEMYNLACELSKPFPFVRVDFYNFDDKIIFGELTFFPGGGLWPFTPRKEGEYWDKKIGEKLVLPNKNNL